MSLYRCAACGSPNVVKHEQKDGFSYKKAIVGTVVFGAIGAVAGIDGKTKEVYSCPDCGATLSHPMDSITQTKIDSVMIDPDTLVPLVFPDMYKRFTYLRNEHEQKRSKENAEVISKLTYVSSDQKNPLNVSEDEFRQSAKEVADAFERLEPYLRSYEKHSMPNFEAKEIEYICQSLSKMRNVVYALSYYSHLIHDETKLRTGLSRDELGRLLFIYVLMDHHEMSCLDFYRAVNNHALLKQAFLLVIGQEKYERKIQQQQKFCDTQHIELSEIRIMGTWFESLPHHCYCSSMIDFDKKGDSNFACIHLPLPALDWMKGRDNLLRCRIGVFADMLHFVNLQNPKAIFEKELPELAHEIKSKEVEISQTQELYEKLTTDQPSTEEQNMAQQISANQASIQELQKAKLFGKKKALAKAEDLANENERLKSQIDALKAARIQENKKAREEIHKQLDTLKKELAELQIPMDDFMRSVRWLPVK